MRFIIINGPNLNLLGKREPLLYGSVDFSTVLRHIQLALPEAHIEHFQSNDESTLIDRLHQADNEDWQGVVLNAGGFTHTSLALADAVAGIDLPVIEVHISNIFAREMIRQHSFISKYARGVIAGFGVDGYRMAIEYFLKS